MYQYRLKFVKEQLKRTKWNDRLPRLFYCAAEKTFKLPRITHESGCYRKSFLIDRDEAQLEKASSCPFILLENAVWNSNGSDYFLYIKQ